MRSLRTHYTTAIAISLFLLWPAVLALHTYSHNTLISILSHAYSHSSSIAWREYHVFSVAPWREKTKTKWKWKKDHMMKCVRMYSAVGIVFVAALVLLLNGAVAQQEAAVEAFSQDAPTVPGEIVDNAGLGDSAVCMPVRCDPESVVLSEYPQWAHTEGYWIGEYSLYEMDGSPRTTGRDWNYPHSHYKGFITGNVVGNAYRQRNVFMYPPQSTSLCEQGTNSTMGAGSCGENGNMKVFGVDQHATTCSLFSPGAIEGPYGALTYTYTELVGRNNSLIYQVYLTSGALNYYESTIMGNPYDRCDLNGYCGYDEDRLMQSQLTTLTEDVNGVMRRTRTAQGFDAFVNVGSQTYASFYREVKVPKETFYMVFNQTAAEYSILESDWCAWAMGDTGGTVPGFSDPGFASCEAHLEESFAL